MRLFDQWQDGEVYAKPLYFYLKLNDVSVIWEQNFEIYKSCKVHVVTRHKLFEAYTRLV